jgi:hypothetical protein
MMLRLVMGVFYSSEEEEQQDKEEEERNREQGGERERERERKGDEEAINKELRTITFGAGGKEKGENGKDKRTDGSVVISNS